MDVKKIFAINEIGEDTGTHFTGSFTVKCVLTRQERFFSDEKRRLIMGAHAEMIFPQLASEAYMLGELSVRITDAPDFWKNSDDGLKLSDGNIILKIFELAKESEKEYKAEIKAKAKEALEKIAKAE